MAFDMTDLPAHPKVGKPTQAHVYRDALGASVLIANRYERKGSKFFLPFDVVRREWKAPAIRPVYNLDRIAAAPGAPVALVEGEKCADALTALGILATTTFGGAKALGKADLSPLAGRKVTIWPDHDEPGRAYAAQAEAALKGLGCEVRVLRLTDDLLKSIHITRNLAELPQGWDVADALQETTEISHILALFTSRDLIISDEIEANSRQFDQVAAKPQELSGGDLDFWHSPDREPFATIAIKGHLEHWPIASRSFREFLTWQHMRENGKVMTSTALEDLCRGYSGKALFEGACHKTFLRIAEQGRTLYLNLGDEAWRAVAIDTQGWQVIERPPVHFTRSRSMAALPVPMRHLDGIEALRPFLNVASEDDFRLLVAWLLGCFHPRGPYPILILTGEQGSAKSTTAKVLRSLIDPANPIGRSAPHSEQDLVIAAKHNHVLAFDNLSTIKPTLADALCRIATGGGFGTRKLHSDTDEVLFTATRPILLNGIPDLVSRPDLADRAIIIHLPVIEAKERQFEAEFWKAFDRAAPGILAALLDAVTCALSRLGSVTLPDRPRMADFAKWITAAEPAFGWQEGEALAAFQRNRSAAHNAAIEENPLAEAILALLAKTPSFTGTATDLLRALRQVAPEAAIGSDTFPRAANMLTGTLRRVQPLLREAGVRVTQEREAGTGRRLIKLERVT